MAVKKGLYYMLHDCMTVSPLYFTLHDCMAERALYFTLHDCMAERPEFNVCYLHDLHERPECCMIAWQKGMTLLYEYAA